ncbi:hypothetical protein OG828_44690 [Streptomyces sp. NBC_00457]|uniref:hypothetical protein n=1 Tax=Streptomyces sp. NBC_00457 TaxID=2975748 RepID=UPI002E1B1670
MPGVPIHPGYGHMTGHAVSGVAGVDSPGRVMLTRDLQRQMQRALHCQGASEGRGE